MGCGTEGSWSGGRQPVMNVVVVGGGIAGVAAAAHLAPHATVTLLEAESTLAYHTTGRSAALFVLNYGATGFRPLARASQIFLESPPREFSDNPLLTERGLLWVASHHQMNLIEEIAAEGQATGADSSLIDSGRVRALVPVMRPEAIVGGLLEPASDIDVAALHQVFVRMMRGHGGQIETDARVNAIQRVDGRWRVNWNAGSAECDAVVNAAGAWGDEVASLADLPPIGLVPMRRTAFMVPGRETYADWPMVVDIDQKFYFKADGTQLLCSLAEEVPSIPTDPRPRIEDVALAIDRINAATTLGIRTVNSQWTGLRTFAPDRELVAGEDPMAPGFFWLVGQGGTGIQTSPAYGALIASLVIGGSLPDHLVEAGVDPVTTDPARFVNR